ncbi:MAG: hypothetical protein ABJ205_07920 [Erythrobacter sp.]|uniref:hypothetical protein n=1 Tax=Erythrobacter sp. TaxID=1042 RepID=UPI0032652813
MGIIGLITGERPSLPNNAAMAGDQVTLPGNLKAILAAKVFMFVAGQREGRQGSA